MPAAPMDSDRFLFNLRVSLFCFCEGATREGYRGPSSVLLLLGEHCSQTGGTVSTASSDSFRGSKYIRVVSSDNAFLVSWNAVSCSGPHTHGLDVLVSSLSGPVNVVKFFIKRLQ